jgi:rhodanese-related sulfurtransferase
MQKHGLAIVIGLCLALFVGGQCLAKDMTAQDYKTEALKVIEEVSVQDAKALLDNGGCLFVDCRTEKEYKMGHVPGAILLQRGLIEFYMANKVTDNKDAKIVVYCKTGGRSCCATKTLNEMGYKKALSLKGGWEAWMAAGYPID